MKLVGTMAAGESHAFRGAKHLERDPDIMRQRVGSKHRLLYKLSDTRLEVLALIQRRDLERTIKTLT